MTSFNTIVDLFLDKYFITAIQQRFAWVNISLIFLVSDKDDFILY